MDFHLDIGTAVFFFFLGMFFAFVVILIAEFIGASGVTPVSLYGEVSHFAQNL